MQVLLAPQTHTPGHAPPQVSPHATPPLAQVGAVVVVAVVVVVVVVLLLVVVGA